MTTTPKILANGQLPNAKGTLYTVPGATTAHVKFISAVKVGGAAETVRFYVKPSGGTSRQISQTVLSSVGDSQRVVDGGESIQLGAADIVEGDTTTASAVDYVITGVEFS